MINSMDYLTKQDIIDFVETLDEGVYCPNCLTHLKPIDTDNGKRWYCPNEMCLNEDEIDLA